MEAGVCTSRIRLGVQVQAIDCRSGGWRGHEPGTGPSLDASPPAALQCCLQQQVSTARVIGERTQCVLQVQLDTPLPFADPPLREAVYPLPCSCADFVLQPGQLTNVMRWRMQSSACM